MRRRVGAIGVAGVAAAALAGGRRRRGELSRRQRQDRVPHTTRRRPEGVRDRGGRARRPGLRPAHDPCRPPATTTTPRIRRTESGSRSAACPSPRTRGQIWTMNADGSGQAQLTDGTPTARRQRPRSSRRTAGGLCSHRYNGVATTQVWIMRADGSEQTQLTFGPDRAAAPRSRPTAARSSSREALRAAPRIWTMNADGSGTPQQLTTGPMAVERFATRRIRPTARGSSSSATAAATADIVVMNADGSSVQPVVATPAFEVAPAFSPDGTKIAYAARRRRPLPRRPRRRQPGAGPGRFDVYGRVVDQVAAAQPAELRA